MSLKTTPNIYYKEFECYEGFEVFSGISIEVIDEVELHFSLLGMQEHLDENFR